MGRKRNLLAYSFLVLISGLLAFSCSSLPTSPTSDGDYPNTITIGLLLPLTGPNAGAGKSIRKSIELALDMERGQIAGHPIKLVIEDEGGLDSEIALQKAKKLVEYDKASVILGPYNDASALTVLPYTSSVPVVNLRWSEPTSNSSELNNKYAFWTTPFRQDNTYPLGLYAVEKGISKVTILGTDEPIAQDYMEGFKNAFTSKGGKVIQEQWTSPTETHFLPYLNNLFPAKAFVCSVLGEESKFSLLKQYGELGLFQKMPVVLAEIGSLSPETMKNLGEDIVGITGIEGYLPEMDNAENATFLSAYEQQYDEKPPKEAVDAFNCARVAIEGLKSAGGETSPDLVKSALLNLRIDLPTGLFSFSRGRIGMRTFHVREVIKEENNLGWELRQEYDLIQTHQKTYP